MEKIYKTTQSKGAKANHTVTQSVDGILEVTVDMKEKYVPKDGDIVYGSGLCKGVVSIYAGSNEVGGIMTYAAYKIDRNILDARFSDRGWGFISQYRPATEAEKQCLFDALAKQGKRWNAEKKQIEDLPRWRAKKRHLYYYIIQDRMVFHKEEAHEALDNHNYELGNYFRTREAAEKVAGQIRDILKNSKVE